MPLNMCNVKHSELRLSLNIELAHDSLFDVSHAQTFAEIIKVKEYRGFENRVSIRNTLRYYRKIEKLTQHELKPLN